MNRNRTCSFRINRRHFGAVPVAEGSSANAVIVIIDNVIPRVRSPVRSFFILFIVSILLFPAVLCVWDSRIFLLLLLCTFWLRTLFLRFSPHAAAGHKPLLQQPVFHTSGVYYLFFRSLSSPFLHCSVKYVPIRDCLRHQRNAAHSNQSKPGSSCCRKDQLLCVVDDEGLSFFGDWSYCPSSLCFILRFILHLPLYRFDVSILIKIELLSRL